MKILVADDRSDNGKDIAEAIKSAYPDADIRFALEDALKDELGKLFSRVGEVLRDPAGWKRQDKLAFDDVDLVVLDNNLAHLKIREARLTAESIAGYVRAFSQAAYVLSLNKNPYVDFDLRYMVGDYQTHADLALNTSHLAKKALWSGRPADAADGFLPWYWPALIRIADRRRRQIEFVQKHYTKRVFDALGIPESAYEYLSLHAKGALSPVAETDGVQVEDAKKLDALTFWDVFVDRGDRSIPSIDDRKALSSDDALKNPEIQAVVARVVAADIDLWFRRDVLGPQEALVDIPHLVARMPFLAGAGKKTAEQWNGMLSADSEPYGMDSNVYGAHLAKRRFTHTEWAPNPGFWWSELKNDETLNELFARADVNDWPDAVFCEDRSRFIDRSDKAVMEFAAEFEGAWGRRHVARIAGVRYAPLSRFAV